MSCGCSGGTSTTAAPPTHGTSGGCGCGATAAGVPATALAGTGFVRPKFFGGMLLTEDDLQATIDYAVAKRRLTNRHVIGAGVVCGLDVELDPCDTTKVVVSPGYAIECCGNDVLVSCEEHVDILGLVRDLRKRSGVDCGEPCDQQPGQEYHLYVRYAETPTSPVAPYAQDDCAAGECEFSRISEGYAFELRCEAPPNEATLIDALRACRPKTDESKRQASSVISMLRVTEQRASIDRELATGVEAITKPPAAAEIKAIQIDPDDSSKGVEFTKGLALVNRVVLAQAQHEAAITPGPGKPVVKPVPSAVLARTETIAKQLAASPELTALPPERQDEVRHLLTVAIDRPDLATLTPVDRAWLREGTTPAAAERTYVTNAESMRQTTLAEMARRGQTGTEDYRALSAMRITAFSATSSDDAVRVGQVYLRQLRDCVCKAFNPPCPSCTDDAVALAKVRVEDCKVVHVCALDRRWVLSPRALGYWLPVVEQVRERLEEVCCDERTPDPAPNPDQPQDGSPVGIVKVAAAQFAQQAQSTGGDPEQQAEFAQISRSIAQLQVQQARLAVRLGVTS